MKSLIPWKRNKNSLLPERWEEWFGQVWDEPFSLFPKIKNNVFRGLPSVDVEDGKNEVTVRAEIPGMTEKDIELTWQDGTLRIRGEKKDEHEEKKKDRYYRECSYGSFTRDIPLGEQIDYSKATAQYKNGVLTVTLPKTESTQKTIPVTVQ
jgi:HSP20 family protein